MKINVGDSAYDWDMDKMMVSEAIALHEKTRMTIRPWRQALAEGDPLATKGLVFLLKLRAGEQPDWQTLDFDLATVTVDDDEDEEEPAPKEGAPGA